MLLSVIHGLSLSSFVGRNTLKLLGKISFHWNRCNIPYISKLCVFGVRTLDNRPNIHVRRLLPITMHCPMFGLQVFACQATHLKPQASRYNPSHKPQDIQATNRAISHNPPATSIQPQATNHKPEAVTLHLVGVPHALCPSPFPLPRSSPRIIKGQKLKSRESRHNYSNDSSFVHEFPKLKVRVSLKDIKMKQKQWVALISTNLPAPQKRQNNFQLWLWI